MSYFSACNDLMMFTSFISAIFIILTVTFQASMAKAESPLHEFSDREEWVQLAGYGEERLSTVLVTGTVLCEACLHGGTQLHTWPVSGFLLFMFLNFLARLALSFTCCSNGLHPKARKRCILRFKLWSAK